MHSVVAGEDQGTEEEEEEDDRLGGILEITEITDPSAIKQQQTFVVRPHRRRHQ